MGKTQGCIFREKEAVLELVPSAERSQGKYFNSLEENGGEQATPSEKTLNVNPTVDGIRGFKGEHTGDPR